jgi:hypothetical protein
MSEAQSAPMHPSITIGKDGRRLSAHAREQSAKNLAKGRKTISETFAARREALEAPQGSDSESKRLSVIASPNIVRRWIKGALGRIRSWPASAQIEAGKMVLGIAGVSLEAHASGNGPLSEMSLQELAQSLAESLDSARNMLALENTSLQVTDSIDSECPNQGNAEPSEPSEEAEPVPGAPELPADDSPT